MKVSVVIPTYNRSEMLYRVLYRLQVQYDPDYEVLVSNDDDADQYEKTQAVCDEFIKAGMPIRHFYTGQYKRGTLQGVGQGWSVETYPYNVGIRAATGDLILLNSGDVMSGTNTIAQHRAFHAAHANAALVSTVHALLYEYQLKIDTYDWKNNGMALLFKGSCSQMYSGEGQSYTANVVREEAHNPYHFLMSVSKGALWAIRGFDEDYFGRMGCGDDDLADRLRRQGIQFFYDQNVIAIHQCHYAPELITKQNTVLSNMAVESGHTLYHQRKTLGIVRNAHHEWGQYPRDMEHLPQMSGIA